MLIGHPAGGRGLSPAGNVEVCQWKIWLQGFRSKGFWPEEIILALGSPHVVSPWNYLPAVSQRILENQLTQKIFLLLGKVIWYLKEIPLYDWHLYQLLSSKVFGNQNYLYLEVLFGALSVRSHAISLWEQSPRIVRAALLVARPLTFLSRTWRQFSAIFWAWPWEHVCYMFSLLSLC